MEETVFLIVYLSFILSAMVGAALISTVSFVLSLVLSLYDRLCLSLVLILVGTLFLYMLVWLIFNPCTIFEYTDSVFSFLLNFDSDIILPVF